MAINVAASTLITAALAVVGDYASSAPIAAQRPPAQIERSIKGFNRQEQRRIVEEIRDKFLDLDGLYAQALQTTLKRDCFEAELFERLPHHIAMTRELEAALRDALVPEDMQAAHQGLRRAVAKVRGRLVQLESLLAQAHETPEYFESDISVEGLKALADHSSRQLAKLA